jgi:phage shock protein C
MARKKKSGLEKQLDDFGEELGKIGKKLERKAGRKKNWFRDTFGVIGPLLSALFGFVILLICIWIINVVNFPIGNELLGEIADFLSANISILLLVFIFHSYKEYSSRKWPYQFKVVSPLANSLGFVIFLWIFFSVFRIINGWLQIGWIQPISSWVLSYLYEIFFFVAILGYFVLIVLYISRDVMRGMKMSKSKKVKRLYRSGEQKILGGVCGGIAEYLEVDPVVIRLLWIIASLAWGFGIIAYFIAWIIIPRNPEHKWD